MRLLLVSSNVRNMSKERPTAKHGWICAVEVRVEHRDSGAGIECGWGLGKELLWPAQQVKELCRLRNRTVDGQSGCAIRGSFDHYSRLNIVRADIHDDGLIRQNDDIVDCHIAVYSIGLISADIRD
jgi:hypothetical protein